MREISMDFENKLATFLNEFGKGKKMVLSSSLNDRFKYLGSITIYSHLQACGIINDHAPNCWMYKKLIESGTVKFIKE